MGKIMIEIENSELMEVAIRAMATHIMGTAGAGMVTTVENKQPEPPEEIPEEEDMGLDPDPDPVMTVSLDELRVKLRDLTKAGKQKEVKALLKDLGATKITDVDPEKYNELMEKAKKL